MPRRLPPSKHKRSDPLAAVVARLTKRFGVDAVTRLSASGAYAEVVRAFSTGLPALDVAIGVGGLPAGKLIELSGPESSGKTTICKALAARAQQEHIVPYILDTEQSGALQYDVGLGLDLDRALGSQPADVQAVFSLLEETLKACRERQMPVLIVWDSLAATPMAEELDREYEDMLHSPAGERARFLARSLPKLIQVLGRTPDAWLVIVNQVREKVGALPYEKRTYSPGGRALRHWAHVRIELASLGQLREQGTPVGLRVRARVVKNKLAPPYKQAEFEIRFDPPSVREAPARVTRTPLASEEE